MLIATLVAVVWLSILLRTISFDRQTERVAPSPGGEASLVSVYVPARDEAEVIERSVRGLLAQKAARVVINDDGSTDATPEILMRLSSDARRSRGGSGDSISFFTGSGPASGECGKPAALAEAVKRSPPETPWLAFVDADVILEPGALAALVGLAQRADVDLVSVLPRLELVTFVEELVMPSVGALVLARHPPRKVADPGSKVAFANGQLILIKAELYSRIGGHRAVVSEVLEDVRLAELAKAAGGKLRVVDGRLLARTRMYASWTELREGWVKNLHLLLGRSVARSISTALLTLAIGLSGIAALGLGVAGACAYAVSLISAAIVRQRIGARPLFAFFAPLGAILTTWVIVESLLSHARRGRVRWKGRDYAGG
ncbi:MAG: glycosyltransferase [Deltaproteobacteria bacterium]|nr:glycosyltransferase [Deltaproteobacteria bacterium]